MKNKIYAMDFAFYNSLGLYDFEARCEMVKDIGYDGINFSIWNGLRWKECLQYAKVQEKYDLEVAGTYVVLNLDYPEDHPHNAGILTMLKNIEGCKQIDLAIQSAGRGIPKSSPIGDGPAYKFLSQALKICKERNLELLLYPHIQFWMDNHKDAVRLCNNINHPNLGIVMTVIHWFAESGANAGAFLKETYPYTKKVHIAGSRRTPLGWGGIATCEPADSGELDNFAIIGTLKNLGYQGKFGAMMWEDGGDPYIKLERAYSAIKGMIERAEKHPNWTSHIIEGDFTLMDSGS
ncbi:MAG: sugar phosphate isomerase/epimerase family protein [Flavobacteriaceae bacterium]